MIPHNGEGIILLMSKDWILCEAFALVLPLKSRGLRPRVCPR